MTNFSQGGCDPPYKTKKALKEAIKEDPKQVMLYSTSALGNEWGGSAADIPEDNQFNVVGPNPYSRRNWYATVKRNAKGVVVVT